MAKTIFRPNEIKPVGDKVLLKLNKTFIEEEAEPEKIEEPVYEGPTAEDLRREAEEFKVQWEAEKQEMLAKAAQEAENIVRQANEASAANTQRQTELAESIKADAEAKAQSILQDAQAKADGLIAQADAKKAQLEKDARSRGLASGREEGFKDGSDEAERLIGRLHLMIEKIMEKRQDILDGTEQQIVDLVLLMTRKVVKVLSESQGEVLCANILEALRKVKSRGDVIIHVNMSDVKLTSEHMKDFMQAVENVQNITVVEDTSVDRGGCIVETDFGSVDARIASQLAELEQKILEISPIRANRRKLQKAGL